MENNNKNNSGLKVAVIILSILLVVFIGLFLYEKIFSNTGKVYESKLLNLSKLENYKNFDGTYGVMESLVYEDSQTNIRYTINLGMDGKVYSGNYSSRVYIDGVRDVVDIISYSDGAGGIEVEKCYMLDDNGDVYVYNISDLVQGVYKTTKVTEISNVDKLINYMYGARENAGSVWGIIAITKDGKYIELTRTGI